MEREIERESERARERARELGLGDDGTDLPSTQAHLACGRTQRGQRHDLPVARGWRGVRAAASLSLLPSLSPPLSLSPWLSLGGTGRSIVSAKSTVGRRRA